LFIGGPKTNTQRAHARTHARAHIHTHRYSDYIRLALLKRFGGLWLDSDVIVTRGLAEVMQRMCSTGAGDFAGFGCSAGLHSARETCEDNYGRPSNWAMASRAGGELVTWCLNEADRMLDDMRAGRAGESGRRQQQQRYAAFGRDLLRRFFVEHPQYKYYHFPSSCMDRDADGRIISSSAYVQTSGRNPRHGCGTELALLLPLYNTAGRATPSWTAFKDLTAHEILFGGAVQGRRHRSGSRDEPDAEGLSHGGVLSAVGDGPSDSFLAQVFRSLLSSGAAANLP
jgi:hypothetical protein